MEWKQYFWSLNQAPEIYREDFIELPPSQSSLIIIRARKFQGQPYWRRAGWIVEREDLGFPIGEATGRWQRIYFGATPIKRISAGIPKGFKFKPVGWLRDLELTLFEPDPPITNPADEDLIRQINSKCDLLLNQF